MIETSHDIIRRRKRKAKLVAFGRIIVSYWEGFKIGVYIAVGILALLAALATFGVIGYSILYGASNFFSL